MNSELGLESDIALSWQAQDAEFDSQLQRKKETDKQANKNLTTEF